MILIFLSLKRFYQNISFIIFLWKNSYIIAYKNLSYQPEIVHILRINSGGVRKKTVHCNKKKCLERGYQSTNRIFFLYFAFKKEGKLICVDSGSQLTRGHLERCLDNCEAPYILKIKHYFLHVVWLMKSFWPLIYSKKYLAQLAQDV